MSNDNRGGPIRIDDHVKARCPSCGDVTGGRRVRCEKCDVALVVVHEPKRKRA